MVKKNIYQYAAKFFHVLAGFSLLSVLAVSLLSAPAHGQIQSGISTNINNSIGGVANKVYTTTGTTDLPTVISGYIKVFLGILGIVAILLVIYAGYIWMTAQADPKRVQEAKDIMKNAVIGLVLISIAYALTSFIFNSIINASNA